MARWREDRDLDKMTKLLRVAAQPRPETDDPKVLADHYEAKRLAGYLLYSDHVGTEVGDLGLFLSVDMGRLERRYRSQAGDGS